MATTYADGLVPVSRTTPGALGVSPIPSGVEPELKTTLQSYENSLRNLSQEVATVGEGGGSAGSSGADGATGVKGAKGISGASVWRIYNGGWSSAVQASGRGAATTKTWIVEWHKLTSLRRLTVTATAAADSVPSFSATWQTKSGSDEWSTAESLFSAKKATASGWGDFTTAEDETVSITPSGGHRVSSKSSLKGDQYKDGTWSLAVSFESQSGIWELYTEGSDVLEGVLPWLIHNGVFTSDVVESTSNTWDVEWRKGSDETRQLKVSATALANGFPSFTAQWRRRTGGGTYSAWETLFSGRNPSSTDWGTHTTTDGDEIYLEPDGAPRISTRKNDKGEYLRDGTYALEASFEGIGG